MRRAAAVLAVLGALWGAESAMACSCAEDPDEKETLHGYDAAATMRLVDVKNRNPSTGSADLIYRILRVYKNSNLREGERFVIKDNPDGAACGLPTQVGERYGLRLYRTRDGRLSSNSCALLSPRELRRAAERSGNARSGGSISCGGTAA
ncbi:MAG: hypothetical protein M3355_02250 [Actinomycetota bacterium]|nr:hypothetical protein [Actinomycetota bacterium]